MEVHLSDPVAHWLVRHGGITADAVTRKNAELFGAGTPLFLSHDAALELHNGAVVARLLQSLFAQNGAECPVSPHDLGPGNDAKCVLRNLQLLTPVLATTFAIKVDAEHLALLVAGDSEAMKHMVEVLHARALGRAEAKLEKEETSTPSNRLGTFADRLSSTFDADVQDNIMLAAQLLAGTYSAVLGSLLGVFVPQACPPSSSNPEVHVCTTTENFVPQSQLNAAALLFNFLTMFSVLGAQAYFGYREWWCIESFDYDVTMSVTNLSEEIALYPAFEKRLRQLNVTSIKIAVGSALLVILNLILSSIHVLRDFSEGKASVTGLLSNSLLLLPRVGGWLGNAYTAWRTGRPVSFFKKVAALPSTIDEDFRFDPVYYKPCYGPGPAMGGTSEGEREHLLAPQFSTPAVAAVESVITVVQMSN